VLVFLSLDGHIALIDTLITSFRGLPIGPHGLSLAAMQSLADWGDQLFMGALRVALPGMTALMVINLGFGVMARAAPALNLFAVGFPITLVFGFVIVLFGLPGIQVVVVDLVNSAFVFMRTIVGST
jgi:flagellar biosynthetic protein FliR